MKSNSIIGNWRLPDAPSTPENPEAASPSPPPVIRISDIDTAPIEASPPALAAGSLDGATLYDRFLTVSNENFELKAKLDYLQSRVRTAETLDKLIEPYASKAYRFMVGYAVGDGGVLVADGSNFRGFKLPDGVLTLLVGSTAVTVVGLVGMVLTGIFVGARKAA